MKTRRIKVLVIACVMGCLVFLIISDILLGAAILLPSSILPIRQALYIEARSRIRIGDERSKVVDALSDAWLVVTCGDPNLPTEELFFYGPQNRDEVKVVYVRYRVENEQAIVDYIGGIESYMLHLYERCEPPPSSVFDTIRVTVTAAP